jgi:protoporphyrinogen oxidase
MRRVRYCILGAGPSGLSFAQALKRMGETSFILLEKESEAGGLCRSVDVDGSPLDIGGGHFLDVRRREVLAFLFTFMPRDEWLEHDRVAKIRVRGLEIDHPLEANLWQLPVSDQVDFLDSLARAGHVRGDPEPTRFDDWVRWKLGTRIAEEYMLPYNRKIWCTPLFQLGTYWLHKLPAVSFRETLESCLRRTPAGTLPAHGRFLYPRHHGFGEVWRRMASDLGDHLITGWELTSVDPVRRTVNDEFRYDRLVTTIPWPEWLRFGVLPPRAEAAVGKLVHTGVDVDYHPASRPTDAHWIYEPEETTSYHRLVMRHNFRPDSKGHWTECNTRRSGPAPRFRHRNDYAYPVSTVDKREAVATIREWASQHHVLPLGRWGTWEHINSDAAVELALAAAQALQSAEGE